MNFGNMQTFSAKYLETESESENKQINKRECSWTRKRVLALQGISHRILKSD